MTVVRAIAYVGTYDPAYPRNAVLIAGLRELGVEVLEFNAPLPPLEAAAMATPAGALRTAGAVAAAHLRLLAQHTRRLDVDAVIVGYPGHLLVPFGRVLAWVRRTRLVFDPLVSLADTFAGDRALVGERSLAGRAAAAVDRVAFGLAGLVLADTDAHARFFAARFGLTDSRLAVVPVGALPEPGATGAARELDEGRPLVVLQYGKWSPLHGADIVLEAAELLCGAPVRFVLVGEGQSSDALRARIAAHGLENVEWRGMLGREELRRETLAADVCLGVFGRSEKAARVIPNKVFDAFACGRPVVTADSPAARECLSRGEDCLLVPAGDAAALAAAIDALQDRDRRAALGAAALEHYRRRFTPAAVAGALLAALAGDARP